MGKHDVTIKNLSLPRGARVNIKMEIRGDVRISADGVREIAADFLLMKVGNLLLVGEPGIRVGDRLYWEVPVLLSNAAQGILGEVGEVLVDMETGEVPFTEEDRRKIKAYARALSERTTPRGREM